MIKGKMGTFLAICLVFFIAQCGLCVNEMPGLYKEALSHFERKEFVAGIEKYYKLLITQNVLLGEEARKRDLRPVREYFVGVRKADPKNFKAYFFLSLVFRIVNMMKPANSLIDGVIKKFPDSPLLLLAKGEYLFWQEDVKQGTDYFLKLQKHPKGKDLWKVARIVQSRYGIDPDLQARKAFLIRQAYTHWDLLERPKAATIFLSVLKDFPSDIECGQSLMNLFMEMDKTADARKVLQDVGKANPGNPSLLILEAKIGFQERNFAEAARVGETVLKNDPENNFMKGLVAEARFQNGEYKRAGELFQELMKFDPNNVGFVIRRKECFECDNNIAEAVNFIEKITKENPKDYFMKMELAGLYERQLDQFSAFSMYSELKKTPNPFQAEAQAKIDSFKQDKERRDAAEALAKSSEPSPRPSTGVTQAPTFPPVSVHTSTSTNSLNPPKTLGKAPGTGSKELFKKLSTLYE